MTVQRPWLEVQLGNIVQGCRYNWSRQRHNSVPFLHDVSFTPPADGWETE